ncbi:hypothetical protein BT93_L0890 [Corymbia citriodora subsp. variegata]|uniref:Uncharacterized protein n=1 Tax=Corymbia citriodora subsp. variegata TaxID=360336 RepID=A0A8T0D090_CORYI|nr:hypothetical protein BT93_L0890 [Corymbia citriodora subsp. variegata]
MLSPSSPSLPPLLSPLSSLSSGFDFSLYKSQAPSYAQPEAHHDEGPSEPEYADRAEPPRLVRAPSLLEHVESINFSSLYRLSDPDPDEDTLHHLEVDSNSEDDDSVPYTDAGRVHQDHQVRRVRSDPKAGCPQRVFGVEEEDEPIVERRRPQTVREGRKKSGPALALSVEEGGDEIDAKVDAFINRYKRDLKLQRLDSIMRLRCSRGAVILVKGREEKRASESKRRGFFEEEKEKPRC